MHGCHLHVHVKVMCHVLFIECCFHGSLAHFAYPFLIFFSQSSYLAHKLCLEWFFSVFLLETALFIVWHHLLCVSTWRQGTKVLFVRLFFFLSFWMEQKNVNSWVLDAFPQSYWTCWIHGGYNVSCVMHKIYLYLFTFPEGAAANKGRRWKEPDRWNRQKN